MDAFQATLIDSWCAPEVARPCGTDGAVCPARPRVGLGVGEGVGVGVAVAVGVGEGVGFWVTTGGSGIPASELTGCAWSAWISATLNARLYTRTSSMTPLKNSLQILLPPMLSGWA